jgi:hypothetical protein
MNQLNLYKLSINTPRIILKKAKTDRPYKSSFLGKTIPLPVSSTGQSYTRGSLTVYMRADGKFIVVDKLRPLGNKTVAVTKTLEKAVNIFDVLVASKEIRHANV